MTAFPYFETAQLEALNAQAASLVSLLVLCAVVAGRRLNARMQPQRFTALVYLGLAATGVVLLLQAIAA